MFKLLFKANKKHILQALPFNIEMETGFSSYQAFAKSCNTACHLISKWGGIQILILCMCVWGFSVKGNVF